jgi:hypothetical protein
MKIEDSIPDCPICQENTVTWEADRKRFVCPCGFEYAAFSYNAGLSALGGPADLAEQAEDLKKDLNDLETAEGKYHDQLLAKRCAMGDAVRRIEKLAKTIRGEPRKELLALVEDLTQELSETS